MCFRVHLTSISTVGFFIFQRTVHLRVLYFRGPFTPGFYISEKCSLTVFIFQRTVHPRFFIFQRTVHPRFLYFRELFTRGFYISENCSSPVFIFQRTVHPRFLYFRELFTPGFYISENCSSLGFSGVRGAHSFLFCVTFCQPTFFLNFVIVLSDLLPITVFDDHFWYLQTFPKYCT
jgi:hypothetical protein